MLNILLNRRRTYGGNKTLPYDSEIEYLETSVDGGQYINTGIIPDNSVFRAEAEIKVKTSGQDAGIFEIYGNGRFYLIDLDGSNLRACNFSGTWTFNKVVQNSFSYNTFFKVISEIGNNKVSLTVNNTTNTVNYAEGYSGTSPLLLFSRTQATTYTAKGVSVSYLKLYKDEELILDLIPVRVGQVGYMYDKVSGRLLGNVGTGTFILGNDKN